jgi:hypothetical protein
VNEQSQKHLDRILNEGIKPQGETLAPIIAKGDVAVIVFEPSPETVGALKMLGWDGETGAFRLSNSKRKQIAASSEQRGDWVTAKWLRSSLCFRPARHAPGEPDGRGLLPRAWFCRGRVAELGHKTARAARRAG